MRSDRYSGREHKSEGHGRQKRSEEAEVSIRWREDIIRMLVIWDFAFHLRICINREISS